MIKTFRSGGKTLIPAKAPKAGLIDKTHMPKRVKILLLQHTGLPAKLLAEKGQLVEEGQKIASADGMNSIDIHASVSGKIVSIEKCSSQAGIDIPAVVIETGGSVKNWYGEKTPLELLKPTDIIGRVETAGIVKLDGSGIVETPRLSKALASKIETIIITGFQTEPYLHTADRILQEKLADVREGILLLKKLFGGSKAVLAVTETDKIKFGQYSEFFKADKDIRVELVKAIYPQENERLICHTITGKEVPSGKNPWDTGVYVMDLETLLAVWEASVYSKPLIERYISFSGDGINTPVCAKARIGTSFQFLTEEYGLPKKYKTILAGSLMRGFEVPGLDTPVGKNTGGAVFLKASKAYTVSENPCIRCGKCQVICPVRIDPALMSRMIQTGDGKEAEGLADCIECGLCASVCPSRIPVVSLVRSVKKDW